MIRAYSFHAFHPTAGNDAFELVVAQRRELWAAALLEIMEAAEKATPGPWKRDNWRVARAAVIREGNSDK